MPTKPPRKLTADGAQPRHDCRAMSVSASGVIALPLESRVHLINPSYGSHHPLFDLDAVTIRRPEAKPAATVALASRMHPLSPQPTVALASRMHHLSPETTVALASRMQPLSPEETVALACREQPLSPQARVRAFTVSDPRLSSEDPPLRFLQAAPAAVGSATSPLSVTTSSASGSTDSDSKGDFRGFRAIVRTPPPRLQIESGSDIPLRSARIIRPRPRRLEMSHSPSALGASRNTVSPPSNPARSRCPSAPVRHRRRILRLHNARCSSSRGRKEEPPSISLGKEDESGVAEEDEIKRLIDEFEFDSPAAAVANSADNCSAPQTPPPLPRAAPFSAAVAEAQPGSFRTAPEVTTTPPVESLAPMECESPSADLSSRLSGDSSPDGRDSCLHAHPANLRTSSIDGRVSLRKARLSDETVSSTCFSCDGSRLCVGALDGAVAIVDVSTGRLMAHLPRCPLSGSSAMSDAVIASCWSPMDPDVFATLLSSGLLRHYDLRFGAGYRPACSADDADSNGASESISSRMTASIRADAGACALSWSPDGAFLAVASTARAGSRTLNARRLDVPRGSVQIWDVRRSFVGRRAERRAAPIARAEPLPVTSAERDAWIADGDPRRNWTTFVAWSPRSRGLFATGCGSQVALWDALAPPFYEQYLGARPPSSKEAVELYPFDAATHPTMIGGVHWQRDPRSAGVDELVIVNDADIGPAFSRYRRQPSLSIVEHPSCSVDCGGAHALVSALGPNGKTLAIVRSDTPDGFPTLSLFDL